MATGGGNVTVNITGFGAGTATSGSAGVAVSGNTTVCQRPPCIALPQERPPSPRAEQHRRPREWFRFENAATSEDEADIYIFDEITDPLTADWGYGISAAGFVKALVELKGKILNVHINSPGGSVFEGLAIYNSLRSHDAQVNVIVDGIAASVASVIAMSGDTVTMAPHSMMMIHDAWGITIGNAADHEQQAKVLNKISDDIAAVYHERGDSRVNWRAKMRDETWLSDEDAVSLGLADRIDTAASAASNKFDLSRFRNAPPDLAAVAEAEPMPTKREIEQALRDAGLSARAAKAFVSEGWRALDARDEPESDADADDANADGVNGEPMAPTDGTLADAETVRVRSESRKRALEAMLLLAA